MRVVLVIMDGLADRHWPELDGMTPLEAADTPNFDKLASKSLTGLMHPLGRGLAPSSEIAHFTLFGYPMDEYPGRGVFEAVGNDLAVDDEDLVIHALFSSVVRDGGLLRVVERPVNATDEDCREIIEDLGSVAIEGMTLETVFTRNAQGIIFAKGGGVKEITDSDPYCDGRPVSRVLATNRASDAGVAERTARAVSGYLEAAYRAMDAHPINRARRKENLAPVNFMLTKWPGRRKRIRPFLEMNGFRAASVCSYPIYRGLALELGMALYDTPYLADPGEDLLKRFHVAEEALADGMDFVHVHSKAPDDAGHSKDPMLKKAVIERLDDACGYLLESGLGTGQALLVVTADHATPSGTVLIHSGDPVPVMIMGETAWTDGVMAFNETACVAGGLGQMNGSDLMPTILNLTDRVRYLGSSLTSEATPYEPTELPAFELED